MDYEWGGLEGGGGSINFCLTWLKSAHETVILNNLEVMYRTIRL